MANIAGRTTVLREHIIPASPFMRLVAALAPMPAAIELLLVSLFPGVSASDMAASIAPVLIPLLLLAMTAFYKWLVVALPVSMRVLIVHGCTPN
jgi:hypothetical protein